MVKTYFLLILMTAILTAFGWVLDRFLHTGGMLMYGFFAFALVMNWVSFFYSDKIVLKMYRAQPVTPEQAPELHEMVERLSQQAGIPKPPLYIIPEQVPNAFATGRSPSHAAVACTEGLLNLMNREQVEGVIAHELSHIRNRDTLVSTVAATLTSAIGMAGHSAQWGAMLGGGRSRDGESHPLGAILVLVMAILAPIVAMVIQMAISRTREYGADAFGAQLTGNPEGLASALERLEAVAARNPMPALARTENMWIVSPLSGSDVASWFSTHPPTAKRAARLREMTREMMTGKGAVASGRVGTFR